jgi:1,4-alpha-glucan branching enzyme
MSMPTPGGVTPRLEQPDLQLWAERSPVLPFQQRSLLLDRYHVDGLRVDGVASMPTWIFRKEGEWMPTSTAGGKPGSLDFLRKFNEQVYKHYP